MNTRYVIEIVVNGYTIAIDEAYSLSQAIDIASNYNDARITEYFQGGARIVA